jgi:hypothetical protein
MLSDRPPRTSFLDRFRHDARIRLVAGDDLLFDFAFQQTLNIAQQLVLINANQ